jgi:HEAT repeat protein
MRYRLSEKTEELIKRLHAKAGLWNRFVDVDAPEEILRQIGGTGEPAVIPDLLSVLLTRDRKCDSACAKAVEGLLRQVSPAEFISLDEFVRGRSDWRADGGSWRRMEPKDVKRLGDVGEASVSIIGLATFHGNGRVREEALRALAAVRSGEELPFILVRANDWVGPIRLMARELIRSRLQPDYAEHLLRWMPLTLRLEKGSRGSHRWIVQSICELFARDELRATLTRGLDAADRPTRRFCFGVAFGLHRDFERDAILRAFRDDDVQIRKAATDKLRTIFSAGDPDQLLVLARNDSVAAVRQAALQIYESRFGELAEKEFVLALLDPSIAVRERAREFFKKRAAFDTRRYYVEHLRIETGRTLAAAIAGTGEVGAAADSGLIEPFLTDHSSKIRVATIRALGKLDAERYRDRFLIAMDDVNSKVARQATRVLGKQVNLVGADTLWGAFVHARHSHAKRLALYLLARTSKWDSITFLLQALSDDDEGVVELCRRYVTRWFVRYNRSFATPTTEQWTKLKSVLSERSLLVSDGVQRQLESMLRSFAGPPT